MAEESSAASVVEDLEDENTITLQEALEEYEEREKISTAVLGASDPHNCSYSNGYLKRQALYACLTCNPKASPDYQPAGVCLACSYKCHDGHDLVELYTKRNFRCDCGNKKFAGTPCILQKEKDELNEMNKYNQNFEGLYCNCHRPYPDPEESEDNADTMVQCIICEDWYHTQHAVPGIDWADNDPDSSVELICGGCMPKLGFLQHYSFLQMNVAKEELVEKKLESQSIGKSGSGAVKGDGDDVQKSESSTVDSQEQAMPANEDSSSSSQDSGIGSLNGNADVASLTSSKLQYDELKASSNCQLKRFPMKLLKNGMGTVWNDGWRNSLCRCGDCLDMYTKLDILFLTDGEDTIESYEALGIAKSESAMLQAEENFNKQVDAMGRVGQIELISGYNDMKSALTEFLKEFAENGQVVQEKDVQEFFENYKSTKRARLDDMHHS